MALTFNGKSSDTYGIHVEKIPDYPVPEKDYEITHVPGRSGDVLIDNGSYKNVELKYEVSLGDEDSTFSQLKAAIINWIYPSTGYCQLIDDDDRIDSSNYYYRMAVYKDAFDISPVQSHGARATLIFNAKPQRYYSSGDAESNAYVSTGGSPTINTFTNPSGFESFPIISVTGSGTIGIFHATQSNMSDKQLYCELDITGDEAGINGYVEYGQEITNGQNGPFGESDVLQKVLYDSANGKVIIVGNFPGKAAVYSVSGNSVTFLQHLTSGGAAITGEIYTAALVPQSSGNNIIMGGKFSSALALCWKYDSVTGKYVEAASIAYMPTRIQHIVPMDNTRILLFAMNSYAYPATFYNGVWTVQRSKGLYLGGVPAVAKLYKEDYALLGGEFKAVTITGQQQAACFAKLIYVNPSDNQVSPFIEYTDLPSRVVSFDIGTFVSQSVTYRVMATIMSNGNDFRLYYMAPTDVPMPITVDSSPTEIDGPISFVRIGNVHSGSGSYGDFSFKLVVSGSISKKVAYFRVDLDPASWGASFVFRDHLPAYSNGSAYTSMITDGLFTEDNEASQSYSYGIFISNDITKASFYVFPPEAIVSTSAITIVSELADAYTIQNGKVVNKNSSVFFVDGIIPKMGKYTTFEPTTGSNISLIKVKPKWWTL